MVQVNINNINDRTSSKYHHIINNTKVLFNPFLLSFFNFTKINSNNNTNLLKILLNLTKKRNKFRIFTNELVLNTLSLLIKIFSLEVNYKTREILNLIKEIKLVLKEEISNIKNILNNESDNANFNYLIDIYYMFYINVIIYYYNLIII